MSIQSIESLLAQKSGGVWFTAGPIETKKVAGLAKKARFAFVHVDGKNVQRKEQLMNAFATALDLPGDFGHNWDALEETLGELEDGASGYLLLYDHIDGLLDKHPDQFETLLEILRDAVGSWKADDTPMVVVLNGTKAPKGVEQAK